MSLIDSHGKAAIAPIIFILTIPTVLSAAFEVYEQMICSENPQKCIEAKTIKKMEEEIEKNERLIPGECKPPKGPRPAAPKERRMREV